MSTDDLICEVCNRKVRDDDEFCPNCGSIFIDDITCENHENSPAAGVCLVCSYAFCPECGKYYNKRFLCSEHSKYEIYESMVRVYGSSDVLDVEYYKNALTTQDLHPVIFSRKASPLSLGGSDYTLFEASGEYNGNIINEIKLMVPLQEVLQAEQIIAEIQNENDEE